MRLHSKAIKGLHLLFLFTGMLFTQTWQPLGIKHSINNAVDISMGYSGGTRMIYIAASQDSVLKSEGSSISWTNKPFVKPQFVACVSSSPNTVYAGGSTAQGNAGVWKSTNGGTSWSLSNSGISNNTLTKIAISQVNSNFLFVGGSGTASINDAANVTTLFKTTNAGTSWLPTNLSSFNVTVSSVLCDPISSNKIFVGATQSNGGVYFSENAGDSWTRKINGMTNTEVLTLALSPQNSSTLYAGTQNVSSNAKIYKSTNSGGNWNEVYSSSSIDIKDIKVDPSSPSIVYAATSGGVLKSTDSGTSWSFSNSGLLDVELNTIIIDNNSSPASIITSGKTGCFRSTDNGATWTEHNVGAEIVSVGAMSVINDNINYVTGNNTTVLVSKLSNNSSVWETASKQILSNGSYFNGKDIQIERSNNSIWYLAGKNSNTYGPKVLKSTNSGNTWSTIYQPTWDAQPTHKANKVLLSGRLIIGTDNTNLANNTPIMYSTNAGSTWTVPSSYPGYHIYDIAENPASSKLIAGGGVSGDPNSTASVLVSTNAGTEWEDVSQGLPSGIVKKIVVDQDGYNFLYATIDNGPSDYLYKSAGNGDDWGQVTVGNYDRFTSIAAHTDRTNIVYLATKKFYQGTTTHTVIHTTDGGATWQQLSTGLPSTMEITHLSLSLNNTGYYPRYLYASNATGIYRIDLKPFAPQNTSVVKFNNNPKITWNASLESDLQSTPYKVYRRVTDDLYQIVQDWTLIGTTSGTSFTDNTILVDPKPRDYYARYRVTATDLNNSVSEYSNEVVINVAELLWKKGEGGASEDGLPLTYGLSQNYPNPFNPSTTISYQLPENSHVSIRVFDLMGKEISTLINSYKVAGYHNINFDASTLSSGIYFYKLTAGKYVSLKRFTLLK